MNVKKLILTNLPYVLFVYPFDKVSQAFRLAPGADLSAKILSIGDGFASAFSSLAPSFHLVDLLIGIAGAVIIRLILSMPVKPGRTTRNTKAPLTSFLQTWRKKTRTISPSSSIRNSRWPRARPYNPSSLAAVPVSLLSISRSCGSL